MSILKKFKPVTPGQRFLVGFKFEQLTKKSPEKSLMLPLKKSGGRNNQGRMTNRHQGGGHKRNLRIIDWKRNKENVPGQVKSIEYDPNRSANIALIHYTDGEKRYIIAPQGLAVSNKVVAGKTTVPEVGNAMLLQNMPVGTVVHNIELKPGQGAKLVRSAGTSAVVVAKEGKYVTLKFPSKERRKILGSCMATVGVVSNTEHAQKCLGKAGRNRWKGVRPRTRGVAMNPVDHKMGGGSGGKASGGLPCSRKGIYAKGQKTRKRNKHSNKYIIKK